MFKLKDKTLAEFKKIYKEEFGIEIDDTTANKMGIELLEFFKLIYRPIPIQQKLQKDTSLA